MALLGPRRLALDDRLAVDAALDEAFAPLRGRTANIGAARVRAAIRWTRPEPTPLRGTPLLARIAEISAAAVVSAFLFGATVAPAGVTDDRSTDAATAGKWILNGRTALQRPIDSRVSDQRMTAGDAADNAATARREASRPLGEQEQGPSSR
jgi:hypothetical protein